MIDKYIVTGMVIDPVISSSHLANFRNPILTNRVATKEFKERGLFDDLKETITLGYQNAERDPITSNHRVRFENNIEL